LTAAMEAKGMTADDAQVFVTSLLAVYAPGAEEIDKNQYSNSW